MTAIAGVASVDDQPLDPQRLCSAREKLATHSGKAVDILSLPGVTLLGNDATALDALREPEPGGNTSPWISVADADLWELSAPPRRSAEVLLSTFCTNGLHGLSKLSGDFALGVWETRRRRLMLARDAVGLRPLLYAQRGERLFFASSLSTLMTLLGESGALNHLLLREYLAEEPGNWSRETVYEGVHRLPPGHALEWREGRLRIVLSDRLEPGPRAAAPGEREWIGEFRATLETALAHRLSVEARPSLLGGGGLDSSVLALLAHELAATSTTVASPILISMGFPGFEEADELPYFLALGRACESLERARFELGSQACSPFDDDVSWAEPPLGPTSSMLRRVAVQLAQQGSTRVLMGEGGDSLFSQGLYQHPEMLFSMPFLEIPRELRFFASSGETGAVPVLLRGLARRVMPAALRRLRHSRAKRERRPLWIEWDDVRDDPPRRLPRVSPPVPPGLDRAGARAFRETFSSTVAARLEEAQTFFSDAGLALCLPYLDRRVIELVLSMPLSLRAYRGVTRRLLRLSASESLPAQIRKRRDKADLSQPAYQWIAEGRDRIIDLFADSRAEREGLVRSRPLLRFLRQAETARPPVHEPTFRLVHRAVALELWLRSDRGMV